MIPLVKGRFLLLAVAAFATTKYALFKARHVGASIKCFQYNVKPKIMGRVLKKCFKTM